MDVEGISGIVLLNMADVFPAKEPKRKALPSAAGLMNYGRTDFTTYRMDPNEPGKCIALSVVNMLAYKNIDGLVGYTPEMTDLMEEEVEKVLQRFIYNSQLYAPWIDGLK